jgi:hypothetical protein
MIKFQKILIYGVVSLYATMLLAAYTNKLNLHETLTLTFLPAILLLYFYPTIYAFKLNRSFVIPVLLVNTFFGWTIVGWLLALYGAINKKETESSAKVLKERQAAFNALGALMLFAILLFILQSLGIFVHSFNFMNQDATDYLFWGLLIGLYFLPTYIAYKCKSNIIQVIFLLNIFLGLTGIGWLFCVALGIWSGARRIIIIDNINQLHKED